MKYWVFAIVILISVPIFGQESPLPEKGEKEIRILSWNIKMLPRLIISANQGPMRRAKLIPAAIVPDDVDIIVFQELFDDRAHRIIKRALLPDFPYLIGPANRTPFSPKANSGLVIFSKIPITHLEEIDFKRCEKEDCLARKGALLVEAEFEGVKFQVMGTHLEAGGGKDLKISQYKEIQAMINRHQVSGVPQILAGDYNTHKNKNGSSELYDTMLALLEAEDRETIKPRIWDDPNLICDLKPNKPIRKDDAIDFILYRSNEISPAMFERHLRIYRTFWDKTRKDLSDHFSVLVRVRW